MQKAKQISMKAYRLGHLVTAMTRQQIEISCAVSDSVSAIGYQGGENHVICPGCQHPVFFDKCLPTQRMEG